MLSIQKRIGSFLIFTIMSQLVSLTDLTLFNTQFIQRISQYDTQMSEFFFYCDLFGFRFADLYNLSNFNIVSSSILSLQPSKRNNLRLLDATMFSASFINAVSTRLNYWLFSYSTITRLFSVFYFPSKLFCGVKPITTHIFRHAFCRRLVVEGLTVVEIAAELGERTVQSVSTYISSPIFY